MNHVGDLKYDTINQKLVVYDGNSWKDITPETDFKFMGVNLHINRTLYLSDYGFLEEIEKDFYNYKVIGKEMSIDLYEIIEPFIINKIRKEKIKNILQK